MPGDLCEVAGTTFAKKVRPRWRYRAYVFDMKNGKDFIEIIGGPPGHELIRSFHPDRVTPVQVKKRRRVSA